MIHGIVYIGSDDTNLYAVDAVTGKEKWRFATGGWVLSSPSVADGIIYVGSNDKNLYAVGKTSSPLTTVPAAISSTPVSLSGTTIPQTVVPDPTPSPPSGQESDPAGALPVLAVTALMLFPAGRKYRVSRKKGKP